MKVNHKSEMISLEKVSLNIPIYNQNRTIKKFITRGVGSKITRKGNKNISVLALNSINCKFKQGERVGLLGHNGSGKTTLLKIIAGIYEPSSGIIKKNCNVEPMIHKGFLVSPELTGKDAVKAFYLFINKHKRGFKDFFNDVKEFSELGDFISMPIKTYSEGMTARLQFAMFTGIKHECLVMDEEFGTGDFKFFEKAQKRLEEFINSSGLFILASHSDDLLRKFCRRGIVLKKGSLVFDGPISDAIDFYHD